MDIELIKQLMKANATVTEPSGIVNYSFAELIQPLIDELESRIPAIDVCPVCATNDYGDTITCCIPTCPVCNTNIEVNVFDTGDFDGDADEKEY